MANSFEAACQKIDRLLLDNILYTSINYGLVKVISSFVKKFEITLFSIFFNSQWKRKPLQSIAEFSKVLGQIHSKLVTVQRNCWRVKTVLNAVKAEKL